MPQGFLALSRWAVGLMSIPLPVGCFYVLGDDVFPRRGFLVTRFLSRLPHAQGRRPQLAPTMRACLASSRMVNGSDLVTIVATGWVFAAPLLL